jgi:hypothetical protein
MENPNFLEQLYSLGLGSFDEVATHAGRYCGGEPEFGAVLDDRGTLLGGLPRCIHQLSIVRIEVLPTG